MMKRYRYTGPVSGATLRDGRSVRLMPGRELELPSQDPYVATLVARGHLRPVEATLAAPDPKPAPKTRKRK